ncbi:MAG: flagellar basal body rod C-terminal domain-containing protein [Thermodesulfobacteriota bacterium]
MLPAIHSGLSGVRAFERKVDLAARNVANAATPGYEKLRAAHAEGAGGGVTSHLERVSTPGLLVPDLAAEGAPPVELSNVDLAEETVEMLLGQRGFQANLQTLRTADQMLGTLLDVKR